MPNGNGNGNTRDPNDGNGGGVNLGANDFAMIVVADSKADFEMEQEKNDVSGLTTF